MFLPTDSQSLTILYYLCYSTCFHKGPRATDWRCWSMVFKSTRRISTYTNTPYLVGAVLYIHIVSLFFTLLFRRGDFRRHFGSIGFSFLSTEEKSDASDFIIRGYDSFIVGEKEEENRPRCRFNIRSRDRRVSSFVLQTFNEWFHWGDGWHADEVSIIMLLRLLIKF